MFECDAVSTRPFTDGEDGQLYAGPKQVALALQQYVLFVLLLRLILTSVPITKATSLLLPGILLVRKSEIGDGHRDCRSVSSMNRSRSYEQCPPKGAELPISARGGQPCL